MSPKLPLHPLRLLLSISSASSIKAQISLLFWELAVGPHCAYPPTKCLTPMLSVRTSLRERTDKYLSLWPNRMLFPTRWCFVVCFKYSTASLRGI